MRTVLGKTEFFITIIILVLIFFFSAKSIFITGFFPVHDDTQPSRIFEMAKALSYGQFPVRWVPDLGYGYGYPIFNFYAPLPYYVGAFFKLLGFTAIDSTKFMYASGIILAVILMYIFVNELSGNCEALIASALYTYAPYHAVNIFIRGAVGEYYAYGFIPLVLYGITKIFKGKTREGITWGSAGLTGILLSHNIMGMISLYFLAGGFIFYFIYLILTKKKHSVTINLLLMILLGIGLSAFFILPAYTEKNYTKVGMLTRDGSDFKRHFVYLDQLWNSSWGYGGSTPGREDGMSFKLGKIHILLAMLSFISLFIIKRKQNNNLIKINLIFIIIFLISVYLMLEYSSWIWQLLPDFAFIQYPWRFLNFSAAALSAIASYIIYNFKPKLKLIITFLLVLLIIFINGKYFIPKEYIPLKDEDYVADENIRYKISKISDEYMPLAFPQIKNPDDTARSLISGNTDYKLITDTPTDKKIMVKSTQSDLDLNIAYFPGWRARSNGKITEITAHNGKLSVILPTGNNNLEIYFTNTPVRNIANTISVLSLFLLVYVSLFWKKRIV